MGSPLFFYVSLKLDLVLDDEIVDCDADPAECKDEHGEKNLLDEVEILFPDVKYAPDGCDDAKDVNDFSYHNVIKY